MKTPPIARRKWPYLLLIVLLLLGFTLGAWLTWRHDHLPAVPLATLVPEDADALLWLDRLDVATRGLKRLTDRVPGARGLREALTLLADVDLLDRDAVEKAGLRPDAGAALFRWKNALWLALPVENADGAQHVMKLLQKRGYKLQGQGPWQIFDRQNAQKQVAQMRLEGGTLVLQWPLTDKPGTLEERAQAPHLKTLPTAKGELHARMQIQADGPEIAQLHALLGPANLILGGLIDRLERLELDVELDAKQPVLHLRLLSQPEALREIADFHMNFLSEGPGALLDLGQVLPDETPLLLRARLNPALLAMVPQGLRDQFLPVTLLGHWHPALNGVDFQRTLLQVLDGQVAAGLLGLADDFPLDPGQWPQRSWRKDLRFFVAATAKSDTDAEALLTAVRTALETSADKPVTTQLLEWAGISVPIADTPWWLLRHGRHLLLVSGRGEGEDLARIASGKFPDLRSSVQGAVEKTLVDGAGRWAGILVETPRIARALRRRGMPDYVVQMLSAVQAVAAGIALDKNGVSLDVELRPAAAETTGAAP